MFLFIKALHQSNAMTKQRMLLSSQNIQRRNRAGLPFVTMNKTFILWTRCRPEVLPQRYIKNHESLLPRRENDIIASTIVKNTISLVLMKLTLLRVALNTSCSIISYKRKCLQ